jgi:hypothetical protein
VLVVGHVARRAEVEHFGDLAARRLYEEHVHRLQIAVDQVPIVEHLDRLAHRAEDRGGVGWAHALHPAETRVEGLSLEELHGEIDRVAVDARLEGLDEVRMADLGRDARFAHEALDEVALLDEVFLDDLERSELAGDPVARSVHRAHPTFGEERFDDVGTDFVARLGHACSKVPRDRRGSD